MNSLASYDRALAIEPGFAVAWFNRGMALRDGPNRREDAIASYEQALAIKPDYAEAKFAACVSELPILYICERDVSVRRQAYAEKLNKLCEDIDCSKSCADWAPGVGVRHPFFLAYQGLNDRDLARRYGSLVCRIMAERYPAVQLPQAIGPEEAIRVGIVSGYYRWHSVWKIPTKGWVSRARSSALPSVRISHRHANRYCHRRRRPAVRSLCPGPAFAGGMARGDFGGRSATRCSIPTLEWTRHRPLWVQCGSPPIQCVSLGHPDTTGYPTMDDFLSSDLMEPPDGQDQHRAPGPAAQPLGLL